MTNSDPSMRELDLVPGTQGRTGGRTSYRYHIIGNPPPNLQRVLKSLKKCEPDKGGYPSKSATEGAIAAVAPYNDSRGASDDLMRFLADYGVLLYYTEVVRNRYFFDSEAGERLLAACEGKYLIDLPSDSAMRDRHRQLAVARGATFRVPGASVPPPAQIMVDDDCVYADSDEGGDKDDDSSVTDYEVVDNADAPTAPLFPVPAALSFLGHSEHVAPVPLLRNVQETGALSDAELALYRDHLGDYSLHLQQVLEAVVAEQLKREQMLLQAQAELAEAERLEEEALAEERRLEEQAAQARATREALAADVARRRAALAKP